MEKLHPEIVAVHVGLSGPFLGEEFRVAKKVIFQTIQNIFPGISPGFNKFCIHVFSLGSFFPYP